jgi:hypothetical protein
MLNNADPSKYAIPLGANCSLAAWVTPDAQLVKKALTLISQIHNSKKTIHKE